MTLKIGDPAPYFELKDENGRMRSLSEFSGKKLVLYFYPKDDTPGCVKQACSLRDGYARLQAAGIVVLGVSYDSPQSHRKFKEKYQLPFSLLSDETKAVAKSYRADGGILGFLMPKRYTYLIDEQGIIIGILQKVDVSDHATEVLEAFENTGRPESP